MQNILEKRETIKRRKEITGKERKKGEKKDNVKPTPIR